MRAVRQAFAVAIAGASFALSVSDGAEAAWPDHTVNIYVPTAAGGNTDLMARFAAEHLNHKLGQPFIVQNRPSAGGVITSQLVGTSPPDGYTLLFAPSSMILLTPLVQPLTFDPDKLLEPVTNVGTGSQVVAIKADLPAKSLAEFIAYAKQNPGKLNFAIAGANNISHLGPLLLFKRTGIELAMVAERGEPQAVTDLTAGSVDFYFGNASVLLNSDRNKIRILAVGTAKRLSAEPDLPTISETIPNFVFSSWNGFFVPAGTPVDVKTKLRETIAELTSTPEMKQRLVTLGIVPGGQTEAEVAATFDQDRASFAEAVKAAGIKKPEN